MKRLIPIIALAALPGIAHAGHKKKISSAQGLQLKGSSPNSQAPVDAKPPTSDPLESVNRATFAANHALYKGVMQPVAKGTEAVLPNPVLKSLSNFGQNLESPVRIINRLVRGEPMQAGRELTKFIVNSSIGVGGLMKPSESFPALRNVRPADTGQTLGKAGIPAGPYLVVPVLGPSNCRDLVGKAGDWAMNPLVYLTASGVPNSVRSSVAAARGTDENRQRMNAYKATTELAADPYVAVREAYTDYRKAAISGQ
jgi:phospholipid-binding lipoprotein MlaA